MSSAISPYEKLSQFQWKVLKATITIPLGQRRTYKWVAQKIGNPKSVRAVGQALKKNPYPVVIPCHRVVCSDGTLGGYAGKYGKRKKELLDLEGMFLQKHQPSFVNELIGK